MDEEGDLRSRSIKETQKDFSWIEVKLRIYESER